MIIRRRCCSSLSTSWLSSMKNVTSFSSRTTDSVRHLKGSNFWSKSCKGQKTQFHLTTSNRITSSKQQALWKYKTFRMRTKSLIREGRTATLSKITRWTIHSNKKTWTLARQLTRGKCFWSIHLQASPIQAWARVRLSTIYLNLWLIKKRILRLIL